MRCGTWCGPARSPMTRSHRCAPCAGSGRGAARVAPVAALRRLTALGPPEAAGRWSLVAPLVGTSTERLHAQSLALLERHGVLTREAVASEGSTVGSRRSTRSCARWRMPGGSGAAISSTASEPPSSRWPARWTACAPPATRPTPPSDGAVHLLAAADPANPYGAALPWPRRGQTDRRPLQRAAGAYVVLVDGIAALYLERGGATLQTLPAADDPRSAWPPPARWPPSSPMAAPASWSSARSMVPGRRGIAVPRAAARRRVRRRLSRPGPGAMPGRAPRPEGDTLFRTAAGLRPYLVGRTVSAARTNGPGPVPQVARIVGHEIAAVEALGKNLLIRFDNGLEIRTHLRMNGSWHRYRPGERWRRPPSRARLVIEVPGWLRSRSMPRSSSSSNGAPRRSTRRSAPSGPDLLAPDFDASEAVRRLRDPARAATRSARLSSTSGRWPGSATGTRTRSCGSSGSRRSRPSSDLPDDTARPARRDGPAVAARQRHARPRRRARHDVGRPWRAGTRSTSTAGRAAPASLPHADRQRPPRATTSRGRPTGAPPARLVGRERDRRPLRGAATVELRRSSSLTSMARPRTTSRARPPARSCALLLSASPASRRHGATRPRDVHVPARTRAALIDPGPLRPPGRRALLPRVPGRDAAPPVALRRWPETRARRRSRADSARSRSRSACRRSR